jgi:DNA-binding response OmpR family regulator/CRP-like cAMP-binding protein
MNNPIILIVDDEPYNVDYLEQELEDLDYETISAENGRIALAQVAAEAPDLILLDIMMPEMNGFQVLEQLKANQAWRDIPVIIISAMNDVDSLVKGIKLGAEDYLPKPFDEVILKARIEAGLEKKRLRDQEMAYLHQVDRLTEAATAVNNGTFDPDDLSDIANRGDALGRLTRLFQDMAGDFLAREKHLIDQIRELKAETHIQVDEDQASQVVFDFFERNPPFDFLTLEEKASLLEHIQFLSFPDGWTIFSPADENHDTLILLYEGRLAIHDQGNDDNPSGYVEAPAFFGEQAIFFHQPHTVRISAVGAVSCFSLPGEVIRNLVAKNSIFRQAFATTFRDKIRIFRGYEIFVNHLFSEMEKSGVKLGDLIESYRELHSILHKGASAQAIDFAALAYAIPRLPQSITSVSALYLAEHLPDMYQEIREEIQIPSLRAQKRKFYAIAPGKIMVLLRDHTTDTVDLITKLCLYAVEVNKIRNRLLATPLVMHLPRFTIGGEGSAATAALRSELPFTAEELANLDVIFEDNLLKRLAEIVIQDGDISLTVQRSDHHYATATQTQDAPEMWRSQIRQELWQVIAAQDFEGDMDVHIISGNNHSVHNCISPWLHKRKESILTRAKDMVPVFYQFENPTDRLYFVSRAWLAAHPEEAESRAASDRENGIYVLEDQSSTGIEVRLIDANRLGDHLDPNLGSIDIKRRTLIVNIDYAYGQQAELIMRGLILLFGKQIRSISILGKSGAIVGNRGDILLPNRLLLQTNDTLYPIPNRDLSVDSFRDVGFDHAVHEGTLLTVLGTIMQSRQMLYFYRHFWDVVGMEMEGSFYLREILRARSLGLLSENVKLRFAYYTSDTPLDEEASLASSLAPLEGIPPVYAITRVILRQILAGES